MRAILKQLSCQDSNKPIRPSVVREFEARRLDAEEDGLEPTKLSAKVSTDLILSIVEDCPAVIIIDALDECQPTRRYEILNALETIRTQSSNVVKILVSSRDDADLKARLKMFPNIEIRASDNVNDVQRFISHEIDTAVREHRLLSGNVSQGLKDKLQRRLKEGARGM